jgi:alpha-galactosidase
VWLALQGAEMRYRVAHLLILLVCVLSVRAAMAQQVAATPPMGWNSWNHFAEKVNDPVVRAAADALVSSGMRDAGYVYVNIDDAWQGKRDEKGFIHPNEKFPDMKALAGYVHAKGLKLGIYSSPGPKTCAGFEGSYGHEEQDAQNYAGWGIDYLKYDLCSFGDMLRDDAPQAAFQKMVDAYMKMFAALQKTGRPIVFSLCQYGVAAVWRWGPDVGGNLWRTTGDINDTYDHMAEIGFGQAGLAKYARPGHWNDPDMLEVGNGGMKPDEYRTHMSLWAILAAPLLAGNDLSKMTPETLAMLTNREVIAIDQDPAGMQGDRFWAEGPYEIWAKPLADGSKAVGLFNRADPWAGNAPIKVNFKDIGFKGAVKVRDVWNAKDLGAMEEYVASVPGHGVVLLRVK